MQAILRTLVRKHRSAGQIPIFVVALLAIGLFGNVRAEPPSYEIEQGVALADGQNPEIIIARKKVEAAHGGLIEARSGYLPSVISSGFADKRETQTDTRLRQEDYTASVRARRSTQQSGDGCAGWVLRCAFKSSEGAGSRKFGAGSG